MSQTDLDDVRAVRAALSLFTGVGLPVPLTAVAEANGLRPGGWVFPDGPGSLTRPEFDDPGDVIDRGNDLLGDAAEHGIRMLLPGEPGWPSGTACDDLACLWVAGDPDPAGLLREAVTVTGARACTAYGQTMASELGYAIASYGWTVVAAAGFGIDSYAVQAARAAGRPAVLVAASGILPEDHPSSLRGTVDGVTAHGAVISPFPPGVRPSRARWTVQQHLLGTVSAATVVVEATRNSRALAVARAAAGAGRTVCAVPGPVTSAASAGCHLLLAEGTATLVSTGTDVVSAIRAGGPQRAAGQPDLYEVSGRLSFDDGFWRTRSLPRLFVTAASPQAAAEAAYEIAFAAVHYAPGATLDAAVIGPDGTYHTVQITTTA